MSAHALTTKGQVTIPAEVRRALQLKPGDRIRFERKGADYVIKAAPSQLSDAFGILKAKRGATVEDMNEGIKLAVQERYKRRR